MEIFGFEITRKKDELRATEVKNAKSFVPPVDDPLHPVFEGLTNNGVDDVGDVSSW